MKTFSLIMKWNLFVRREMLSKMRTGMDDSSCGTTYEIDCVCFCLFVTEKKKIMLGFSWKNLASNCSKL